MLHHNEQVLMGRYSNKTERSTADFLHPDRIQFRTQIRCSQKETVGLLAARNF